MTNICRLVTTENLGCNSHIVLTVFFSWLRFLRTPSYSNIIVTCFFCRLQFLRAHSYYGTILTGFFCKFIFLQAHPYFGLLCLLFEHWFPFADAALWGAWFGGRGRQH
ncbi:hypothetical protein EGW08_013097 [Elysia chlorotica]|uniref:Uncharacterized protein n=1 Tax=Elysia chlorotica TaxID=188477 RepID=A0A3S1BAV1_ELYCH|nr:hypothetical protein EGW08_013097 [Elysia chlorotica]